MSEKMEEFQKYLNEAKEILKQRGYNIIEGENTFTAEYEDGDVKEEIRVSVLNLTKVIVSIITTDKTNEIYTPVVIAQHSLDPVMDITDEMVRKEVERIENMKPFEVAIFYNAMLTAKVFINELDCFVNIPHKHLYPAIAIDITLPIDELRSFLDTYYILVAVMRKYFNI